MLRLAAIFTALFALFLSPILTGCAMSANVYQNERPAFKLNEIFNGKVHGYGMLQNWRGQVTRRFSVNIVGTFTGPAGAQTGTLDETFYWSDGEVQKRLWQIKQQPNGEWVGTAGDLNGQAVSTIRGNAMNWRYQLLIPVNGSTVAVSMDDWMYLIAPGQVLNLTSLSKFGLPLGKLTIFLQNQAHAADVPAPFAASLSSVIGR
jgi:hypothetical protein